LPGLAAGARGPRLQRGGVCQTCGKGGPHRRCARRACASLHRPAGSPVSAEARPQPRRAPCAASAARPRRSQLRRLCPLRTGQLAVGVCGSPQPAHSPGAPRAPRARRARGAVNCDDFPLADDFQRWKRGGGFSFCRFPFVFEAATKAALLDMENRGEQARRAPVPPPPRAVVDELCGCSRSLIACQNESPA